MLTAPSIAVVRARFPEFADTADAEIAVLTQTALSISAISQDALLYLVGHLIAISAEETGEADGGSGEVVSERIGAKAVSYAAQAKSGDEAFYTRTAYGRLFLALERRAPARALSVRVF